jgi:putative ABC transport system permease protein
MKMLAGNADEILSQPMAAMVSSEIAEKMGGIARCVGQEIELESAPGRQMTIGGVFRALPKNSHLKFDVIVSMSSIGRFISDGSMNWFGNDRYKGYVKLHPGVHPGSLREAIDAMQDRHVPPEMLTKAGINLRLELQPLSEIHSSDSNVRRMKLILSILAFMLLFASVMNYLLAVVSSMINRGKEMAVRKCYGASDASIYRKALSETLNDLLIALICSAALIFIFKDTILSLMDTHVSDLFTWQSSLLLSGVCGTIFLTAGFASGYLYVHIPVAAAFRRISENKRFWKLGLLFLQFVVAGFFICLLMVIHRQYNFMVDFYPGYNDENLAYCNLSGVKKSLRQTALDEVSRLSEVAAVTSSDELLFDYMSGNNIFLPDDDRQLFNIADIYDTGDGYLNVMEIPVIDGRSFREEAGMSHEVMVSRSFAEKIKDFTHWSDGVTGKQIGISEHSRGKDDLFTICGIYDDVLLGIIGRRDERPSVMFYTDSASHNLLIKYHHLTPEAILKTTGLLTGLLPDKSIVVTPYSMEMESRYIDSLKFRNSVMTGAIVALIIALIGLLGYTSDEVNRRTAEVAIRKINGAKVGDILRLFVLDILKIALPALLLGIITAAFTAQKWMENFSEKTDISILLFVVCLTAVLLVILASVTANSYRIATKNPADTLARQ